MFKLVAMIEHIGSSFIKVIMFLTFKTTKVAQVE